MRTRSQSRNNFSQQEASPAIVEPLRIELPFLKDQFQEDPPVDPSEVPMADNRTMAELLQAFTEGYEDAIVIPKIAANNFELRHGLINLVQNKQFFRHDKEDPHAHIRYFNKITSMMRVPNVPSSSIKLMIFPFSLEGAARIWLEKEAPRSILTWDDLVTKFINQACPHHGFSELHQLDTFYNALNINDQDSLNSAAGGNFLDKMPRECLKIIKSKSKVRQSRAKAVVSTVSTSSSTPAISSEVSELKDMVRVLLLDKKNQSSDLAQSSTPAPVKVIEPGCVTCGGTHSYQNYPATSGNDYRDNIQEYVSQAAATNYNQGNTGFRPQMVANQIRPPGFPPHQNHQNNFNRGNNLNQNRGGNFNQSNYNQGGNFNQGTGRALIDVHKGELTLRIGNEAITYNLDHTVRYSANYNQMTANKIDVICEMYSQEVLGFSDVTASGNPTSIDDPIVSTTSPTLTPFGDSDFLLFEEADAFLAILNSEPLPPLPNHKQYMPSYKKELKACEAKTVKSSVDEPPEVELKDLPPHLEYAFLEGENKLPVIIAKELGDEKKSALIKVLKSHKRAITWKLSDIHCINPEFCTHKILMEEDYKPAVQHQRRVNPKIHDVIKKEVEKLLDAGLIYPIADSPWVSLVHCVPKKGGFTIVENEENKLILTRLVARWRVCIDYRKLNEATRKDHFPLPFMDQMLERLTGNEYYYLLDGFFGYFQIPIDPRDQEKTTFTCPYGTFAYRRMPFSLYNAPSMFQRCMLAIFHDMVEKIMEVFMDDFSVFGNSFKNCLSCLDKMLQRCEDTNLSLSWEKSHFMVK
nr:reverse transcriptase domain-containing protein [Tanacetum cinerariifolium]